MSDMESRLRKAFQYGLVLPSDTDFEALEFAKTKEWDSIAHLVLIASIEKEFAIMIETSDMLAINSYPKAREIVNKYL